MLDPLAQPIRELQLELRPREVWGLDSAEIVAHGPVRRAAADSSVAVGSAEPAAAAASGEF